MNRSEQLVSKSQKVKNLKGVRKNLGNFTWERKYQHSIEDYLKWPKNIGGQFDKSAKNPMNNEENGGSKSRKCIECIEDDHRNNNPIHSSEIIYTQQNELEKNSKAKDNPVKTVTKISGDDYVENVVHIPRKLVTTNKLFPMMDDELKQFTLNMMEFMTDSANISWHKKENDENLGRSSSRSKLYELMGNSELKAFALSTVEVITDTTNIHPVIPGGGDSRIA